MQLLSKVFENGKSIPSKYTCDGEDVSPPLEINEVGSKAESLALVCDDPDAPGQTFDHWVIWNISADIESIPEGVPTEEKVNSLEGAIQGKNDFNEIGYRGPCPPAGPEHRYRFKLYALDTELDLSPGATKADLEEAIDGHVIEEAGLTGKYGR
ncbi:MAG: YbhB/YbcL family Raf kinase inhibitor-like protein [Hadesarchaea archaeon]|nr:YbhB/YbcL family Raf kinase inhibitor-like protein [Hadesarchaea archaeon]